MLQLLYLKVALRSQEKEMKNAHIKKKDRENLLFWLLHAVSFIFLKKLYAHVCAEQHVKLRTVSLEGRKKKKLKSSLKFLLFNKVLHMVYIGQRISHHFTGDPHEWSGAVNSIGCVRH